MKKSRFIGRVAAVTLAAATSLTMLKPYCMTAFAAALTSSLTLTASNNNSYVTFEFTEETDIAATGFDGSAVIIESGSISANDTSNVGNKIKLNKGTTVKTLDSIITSGIVHFETAFLTTATSKASLFMRILNSEGEPMIDIAQYGSSNLNLYIDKQTSGAEGAMAGRFAGLPVKKWAKAKIDIDLDASKAAGHLVFDVAVYVTDSYESGNWTKFAEYDESIYLNSTTAPTTTGAASTIATVFDVASIELYNAGGTNYYDDMFFEAIGEGTTKQLKSLEIVSMPEKTKYNVGDTFNETGMELAGTYLYTFADGSTKEEKTIITNYDVEFDSSTPGEKKTIKITAQGQSVNIEVTVLHNPMLDYIEAELVSFINNKLVTLEDDNSITLNKRQIKLPIESEDGAKLSWAVSASNASITDRILTVEPSSAEETVVMLTVTAEMEGEDGRAIILSKDIKLVVPKSTTTADANIFAFDTDEKISTGLKAMFDRGFLKGQERLNSVASVLSNRDQLINTEEMAAILVNMFEVDTTYTKTVISREDIDYNAWYAEYVIAAFQLSLETKTSRVEKRIYGIGQKLTKEDVLYMVSRIVAVDQTTLPDNYAEKMFE